MNIYVSLVHETNFQNRCKTNLHHCFCGYRGRHVVNETNTSSTCQSYCGLHTVKKVIHICYVLLLVLTDQPLNENCHSVSECVPWPGNIPHRKCANEVNTQLPVSVTKYKKGPWHEVTKLYDLSWVMKKNTSMLLISQQQKLEWWARSKATVVVCNAANQFCI